jgi:hypothetical protein
MADVLPDQAMEDIGLGVLYREIGTVADHDQTLPGGCLVMIGSGELCALVEAPAAAFLDLSDALDLPLGKPPSRHNQGLKW